MRYVWVFGLLALLTLAGYGAEPFSLDGRVSVEATDVQSTLNRATGDVETSVTLRLRNTGDRPVRAPLWLAVRFGEGDDATVAGAEDLRGEAPYNGFVLDWSDLVPEALAPEAEVSRTVVYARPAGTATDYTLAAFGVFNRDPVAALQAPAVAVAGEPVEVSGVASFDPEGGELDFFWEFGDGTTSGDPATQHTFTAPGSYTLRLRVEDPEGARDTASRTMQVVPAGEFALAQVRALDGDGQPLGGVTVERAGEGGPVPLGETGEEDGFFVGEGEPGMDWWRFSAPGHLTVWREAGFLERAVVLVPSPWMTRVPGRTKAVSPLAGATLGEESDPARIEFPAGALSEAGEAGYTRLGQQALPLPLPRGWRPVAAFHVSTPGDLLLEGTTVWQAAGSGGGVRAVVRLVESGVPEWRVTTVAGSGGIVTSPLAHRGTWVLVAADGGDSAPPLPVAGEALPGAVVADGAVASADGVLDPPTGIASLDPAGVITRARVVFEGAEAMTSGRLFRAEIAEHFTFTDGTTQRSPDYDTTFRAYRATGSAQRITAEFPLRPTLLFDPAELAEARVTVTVLDAADFGGSVLDPSGGTLSGPTVTLRASAGAFAQRTVAELREIEAEGFADLLAGSGLAAERAFQLNSTAAALPYEVTVADVPVDSFFVLARLTSAGGGQVFAPVLRMRSGADGVARPDEPDTPPRLPGLSRAGRYVLLTLSDPQGLITGTARALDGAARSGLLATVAGTPWGALSDSGGAFCLIAPAGQGTVELLDPADGNRASAAFTLADADDTAEVDLQVVPTGPRVIAVEPAHDSTGVSRVAPVRVTFSEPVDAASFGLTGLALLDDEGEAVAASLSLNLARTVAELFPTDPLGYDTAYTIIVSEDITDAAGNPLEGESEFSFHTRRAATRGVGAQLTIYEPGALNIPEFILDNLVAYTPGEDPSAIVVHGSQGSADPEVPVILVNESTGETSTVLSKVDGSFYGVIAGTEEDFVSATFINANESFITLPVSRQEFDNGFVGLYNSGGILEAESDGGPVRVTLEPDAIETRSKFRVQPVNLDQLLDVIAGSEPTEGQVLGGVTVSYEVGEDIDEPAKVAFPLDRDALELPEGIHAAEDASFVLTRLVEVDGGYVYEVIDVMRVDGDMLVTASPPYPGVLFTRIVDAVSGITAQAMRMSDVAVNALANLPVDTSFFSELLMPMMMPASVTTDIVGTVYAGRLDGEGALVGTPDRVPGAVVTYERPPFPGIGRPRPGQLVTTADSRGNFAFRIDSGLEGTGFQVSATHPRFPLMRAVGAGFISQLTQSFHSAGVGSVIPGLTDSVRRDLYFALPAASGAETQDTVPPVVRSGHTPSLPAAETPVSFVISATDNRAMAGLDARLLRATNSAGEPLPLDETVTMELLGEQTSSTRIEQRFELIASRPARVVILIDASDAAGNLRQREHVIDFGRAPMIPDGEPDGTPPLRVQMGWPMEGSTGHAAFPEILLRFSKALPEEAFADGQTDWLYFATDHRVLSLTPSPDFREVRVRFAGSPSGQVRLVVSPLLQDRSGQAFDQNPGEEESGAYELTFSLAASPHGILDIVRGGGVRGQGAYYYALDRTATVRNSELVAYDLRDPANPVELSRLRLPDLAGDLAFLPQYAMPTGPAGSCGVYDLVVVVGGANGGGGDVGFVFPKWLWIVDVSDPSRPVRLSSGIISRDPLSRVVKTAVSAPLAAFLETSFDSTAIHLLDLVAFTIGQNATQSEREQFPESYEPGVDLTGDGSFCGPGERPSLPGRDPARFYGEVFSFAPLDPRDRIIDFDMDATIGTLVSVSYNRGEQEGRFRNYLANFDPLDDDTGALDLPPGAEPKRVKFLAAQPIFVDGHLRVLDLAVVSVRTQGATGALAVIDVSEPTEPFLLDYFDLPPGTGIPNSIELRPDGWITLALGRDLYVLDPQHLLDFDPEAGWLAVRGVVPGFGSGVRSYVNDPSGIQAVNAEQARATFTGPTLSFVTLPDEPRRAVDFLALSEAERRGLVHGARPVERARTQFKRFSEDEEDPDSVVVTSEPSPDDHYYILVRAPGGDSGVDARIDLLVSNVTGAGQLPEIGPLQRLPNTLVDDGTRASFLPPEDGDPPSAFTYPGSIQAHRLSDRPSSDLYNVYLAGPFTLHGTLSPAQAQALEAQLPRHFLRADRHIVAALGPGGETGSHVLDPFRSDVVENRIRPGANTLIPVEFQRRPLIFVPGVMASRLVDTSSSPTGLGTGAVSDLWIDPTKALGDPFNDLDKLALSSSGESDPGIRAVDAIRNLAFLVDIQGPFLRFLREDLDYREYLPAPSRGQWFSSLQRYNRNPGRFSEDEDPDYDSFAQQPELFVFPYDWRLDNAENAERLGKYVDLIMKQMPDVEDVDIVAHSMGGLVSRRYILENPGKVNRLITIATPFLGAPKAIYTMYSGDLDDWGLNFVTPFDKAKRLSRHMPALHQLMPNKGYFDLGGRPLVERDWDLNRNRFLDGPYDYGQYSDALDDFLFPAEEGDEAPLPMLANETFNADYVFFDSSDNMIDWSGDTSGTRYFHIVAVQQTRRTIDRIYVESKLRPDESVRDIALTLPALTFVDSNQIGGSVPILPTGELAENAFERTAYRVAMRLRPRRGAGDGTVPLLSATRAFGGAKSFHAPDTTMIPIVARGASSDETERASHMGVLNNPELHELIGRILGDELDTVPAPTLTINTEDTVDEGSVVSFSVSIENAPPGETPVIVWDTGDGRVVRGSEGETHDHIYMRDGEYNLICAVWFPGRHGAVASRTITVNNVPPTVSLRAFPENPVLGETVRIIAEIEDPGSEDVFNFEWILDGETLHGAPLSAFFIDQTPWKVGTYNYTVRVSDGTVVTPVEATLALTIEPGRAESDNGDDGGDPPGDEDDSDPAPPDDTTANTHTVDVVDLLISGHTVEATGSLVVEHDNKPLLRFPLPFLGRAKGMTREALGPRQESVKLYRYFPDGSAGTPGVSQIKMMAASSRVKLEATFRRANGEQACFRWKVETEAGAEVTFTVPWDDLLALTDVELKALVAPAPSAHRRVSCNRGSEPALVHRRDAASGVLTFASVDNDTTLEGEPVFDEEGTFVDKEPVAFVIADPLDEPCEVEEDSLVIIARGPAFHAGAAPHDARALLTRDRRGRLQTGAEAPAPTTASSELTEERAAEIRNAVKEAFRKGYETELFKKFVIDLGDLLILEQGTGAGLWKDNLDKLIGAYVPGKSDNDYEIFMPVFKTNWNHVEFLKHAMEADPPTVASVEDYESLTPKEREAFRAFRSFRLLAHTHDLMTGDWYFAYPFGMAGNRNLGPVPYFDDTDEFNAYLAAVTHWRYYLPKGSSVTLMGGTLPVEKHPYLGEGEDLHYFDVEKGAKFFDEKTSVFNFPATPAEIISFALTERLKQEREADEEFKKLLPDTSFFPFRKEHFFFGIPSLERPPPFGDDPIGDAGTGRGLLLLKWVLEGTFLPPFSAGSGSFNSEMSRERDLEFRTRIYERLKERRDQLALEGYEWGIYQEFAALADNVPIRLLRADGAEVVECVKEMGDFLLSRDAKALKKLGKAAIRGVLARLIADSGAREAVFSVDPSAFGEDDELKSFEHFIARVGKAHLGLFGGFTEDDIDNFLRAKLGDKALARELAADREAFDAFILRGFELLRDRVQQLTRGAFASGLSDAAKAGRKDEWWRRVNNVHAVDHGFTPPQGSFQPGRRAMHGADPGHQFTYTLAASLRRVGDMPDGPYSFTLEGDDMSPVDYGPVAFENDDATILYVKGKPLVDGGPSLSVRRPPQAPGLTSYTLGFEGGSEDSFSFNDQVPLSGYVIPTTANYDDAFASKAGRKIVYRGIHLSDETLQTFITNELEAGRLLSASVRNGEPIADGVIRGRRIADDLFDRNEVVSGFLREDYNTWTNDRHAAVLAHIQPPPTAQLTNTFQMVDVGEVVLAVVDAAGWIGLDQKIKLSLGERLIAVFRVLSISGDNTMELEVVERVVNVGKTVVGSQNKIFRAAVGELGISTARRMEFPLLFASAAPEGESPYLVVLEVQPDHGGYQYLPINVSGDEGVVYRSINPKESDEVTFLGELPFLRARLFRMEKDDDPDIPIPDWRSPILKHLGTFNGGGSP